MLLDNPMNELEQRIMSDIIRRIRQNGEITRAADWQISRLYQLGVSYDEIDAAIAQALGLSDKELEALYSGVISKGYARDKGLYDKTGVPFIPFEENEELRQLISSVAEQTGKTLKNITGSLGFAVNTPGGISFLPIAKYYQRTLDSAMLDIASGAFDYNTVLKRVVSEMTNSGLRTVDYASGHSNRVEVAARRALQTGIGQLADKVNNDNAKALDTDYFEVTVSRCARPTHAVWQGRVYSSKDLVSVCGYGRVDGLCGANCYHDKHPFIPGISQRAYTDEELDEIIRQENTPREWNGKQYTAYEATQRQRRLETTMRAQRQKIKLLEEGGADEDTLTEARARYRTTSAEYSRFSNACGIPQQRERVTVDGLGAIGNGKWHRDLTNKDFNDIIDLKGKLPDSEVRKWYREHDKNIPNLIDKSLPIEQQARQACELRNRYRTQARDLMDNQELRKQLDITDPNKSFEELLIDKMERKGLNRNQAIEDILNTATKTRKSIDKKYGLED